jgi:hypothetical protein
MIRQTRPGRDPYAGFMKGFKAPARKAGTKPPSVARPGGPCRWAGPRPRPRAAEGRRQHVLRKRLAKSQDLDPHCGGGALGRVLTRALVDQRVSREGPGWGGGGARREAHAACVRPRIPRRLGPTPGAVPGSGTPTGLPAPGRWTAGVGLERTGSISARQRSTMSCGKRMREMPPIGSTASAP